MNAWRKAVATAACIVGASAALAAPQASDPAAFTAKIDPSKSIQTLEGFGASGAWWAQEVGGWPEVVRRRLLTWLFDPEEGIGLTIYRHNLGAGSSGDAMIRDPMRRAQCHADSAGVFCWTRDADASRILREAVAAGAARVILFANSPPVFLTQNGRAYGAPRPKRSPVGNLDPAHIDAFAAHLAECARHFARDEGLPVVALSPVNEPEWGWDEPKQEGCHYTPAEAAAVLLSTLRALDRLGLGSLRVEGPEGGSWKTVRPYIDAIASEPELRERVTQLGVHSYFSTTEDKRATRAHLDRVLPRASLHMTEWTQFKRGRDLGMDSALELSRIVTEDLSLGRCATWQYWIAASPYNYHDGLVHLDMERRMLIETKRLWALGQFSRFLRPGWRLLSMSAVTADASAPLTALAASSPDGGRCAVVVTNPSGQPAEIRIAWMDGRRWEIEALHVTDASRNLVRIDAGRGVGQAAPKVPARSVATLCFRAIADGASAAPR